MRIDQEIIKDQNQKKQQHVFTPLINDYALMASSDEVRKVKKRDSLEEQKSTVMRRSQNKNL